MARQPIVMYADGHEQESAWSGSTIVGDASYSLSQIVDYAISVNAAAVIGAGDLIDKQRNRSAPITALYHQLDRLQEEHIRFLFVQGQHDWDTPPWLAGHSWAQHIHKEGFTISGITGYGLDFQQADALKVELEAIPPDTTLLIAHQGWSEWMGEVTSPQGDIAQIPHVRLLFTGDYHQWKRETYRGRDGQELVACSPGSICMQDITEEPDKSFVVLSAAGVFKRIKLRCRRVIHWDVMNKPEDLEAFVVGIDKVLAETLEESQKLELPPNLMKPLLRITYSAALGDTVRRVENAVQGRAHLFWKENVPEARKEAAVAIKKRLSESIVTPLTELPTVVDKKTDPEVYDLTHRLLNATDPKQEYAKWRAEQLQEE